MAFKAIRVLCSECQHEVRRGTLGSCTICNGILEPKYPSKAVQQLAAIEIGHGLDRYRPLLPVSREIPALGEGNTPLVKSSRHGPSAGLTNLYFKLEGCNPTGSFKDRAASLALALALEDGADGVLTVSSGNAGAAISAYAAACGIPCLILLEPGNPGVKLRQIVLTGASVIPVEGVFSRGPGAVGELIRKVAGRLNYYAAFVWAPANPYILEGIKSMAYEIAAQLGEQPDVVVCPTGGGDMLAAIWRGFLELRQSGVTSGLPRMVAVQSTEAPPLLNAFQVGAEHVQELPFARSRISGINVAFSGDHALAAVRRSGGFAVGLGDHEILDAQCRLAAEEGIWVEPAGAAPLAALPSLLSSGVIEGRETVVCVLSGAGFKDSMLARSEAEALSDQEPVPFDVEALVQAFTSNSSTRSSV